MGFIQSSESLKVSSLYWLNSRIFWAKSAAIDEMRLLGSFLADKNNGEVWSGYHSVESLKLENKIILIGTVLRATVRF